MNRLVSAWRIQIWYLLMFQAWVKQECPKACLGR